MLIVASSDCSLLNFADSFLKFFFYLGYSRLFIILSEVKLLLNIFFVFFDRVLEFFKSCNFEIFYGLYSFLNLMLNSGVTRLVPMLN